MEPKETKPIKIDPGFLTELGVHIDYAVSDLGGEINKAINSDSALEKAIFKDIAVHLYEKYPSLSGKALTNLFKDATRHSMLAALTFKEAKREILKEALEQRNDKD